MTDHTALISSLEKATEGSRELDRALALTVMPEARLGPGWMLRWPQASQPLQRYTTDLGAAVALVEWKMGREHPHWTHNHKSVHSGQHGAYHLFEITWPSHEAQGRGRTLALSACAALLRALQHQGGGNG